MKQELIPLNSKDKSHLKKLIEVYKEGVVVDLTVISFFSFFCLLIGGFTIYVKSEFWYVFLLVLILPAIATIYTIWEFKHQTIDLRKDLVDLKKTIRKDKLIEKGTRTDGWTVRSGAFKYKTVIKSFEYYLKTENYLFLTREKELFDKYNLNDTVLLEVSINSDIVLGIKDPHNMA